LDHCEAIDIAISKGKIGEIYNIGADCEKRNIDLVKLLMEKVKQLLDNPKYKNLINIPLDKINDKLIKFVKDRPGHDFRYAMDSAKIRKLGWEPKVSFEEGIKLTILWYFENMNWLKNVISGDYREYYEKMYKER